MTGIKEIVAEREAKELADRRDLFAAAALTGLVAHGFNAGQPKVIASIAAELADAQLAALAKGGGS